MTTKEKRAYIYSRVDAINEHLGTNYRTTFAPHYGGWDLYEYDEKHTPKIGSLSFHLRKSTAEMCAYLEGVINTLYLPR